MYQTGKRILSLLLALILLTQLLPVSAFAQEDSESSTQTQAGITPLSEGTDEEPYVVGELTSQRKEDEKHFRLSNGTFMAVQYGTPVHYADADGQWVEFDNTLVLRSSDASLLSENETNWYEAINGDGARRFADSYHPNQPLFAMVNGEYGISMSIAASVNNESLQTAALDASAGITAQVDNPADAPVSLSTEQSQLSLEQQIQPTKLSSTITYENIWPGTSLVYQTQGYDVKETIVVSNLQAQYEYDFYLELTGLTPTLNDDGSISLANELDERIYYIPAPFMEDTAGDFSEAVHYTLTPQGNGYLLTVTADAEWINDSQRTLPVMIDPSVYQEANSTEKHILTGYVNDTSPSTQPSNRASAIYCGLYSGDTSVGLIYVKDLPDVPAGCVITGGYMRLYRYGYSGEQFPIRAYTSVVNSSYDASYFTSLTWNQFQSDITYGTANSDGIKTALDYVLCPKATVGWYRWDITTAMQQWYSGDSSISRILVLEGSFEGGAGRARFCGYTGYGSDRTPHVIVYYQNAVGIEGIYSYHTQSMGRAGTGYVNNFTLGLTVENTLVSSDSQVTPFSLSLYYNSLLGHVNCTTSDDIITRDYTTMASGLGWKVSVQQTVTEKTLPAYGGSTSYLVYMDADGTEHYFQKNGSNYEDEEGLGLTITTSTSSSNTIYTMKDKEGNCWEFYNGYLTVFTDHNGNRLLYGYDSNTITTTTATTWKPSNSGAHAVTSVARLNAGQTDPQTIVTLAYDSGYLTTVTQQPSGRVTTLVYSPTTGTARRLTSITYADGYNATYTYTGDTTGYRMTQAYDSESKCGIHYEYVTAEGAYRISRVRMYEGTGSTYGDEMTAQKISGKYTRFCYPGPETGDDIVEYYSFDDYGRTINITTLNEDESQILGVSAGTYTQNTGTDPANNRMTGAASTGSQGVNLLNNSGLEATTSTTNWVKSGNGSYALAQNTNTTVLVTPRTGNYLLKMYLSNTSSGTNTVYQQVYLTAGETYVFSGYANTACATDMGSGGAFLSIQNSSGTELIRSAVLNRRTNTAIDRGWERLEVSYTPTTSALYNICANWSGSANVAAFDDFQLEHWAHLTTTAVDSTAGYQGAVSAANLLQMGSFQFFNIYGGISEDLADEHWTYDPKFAVPTSDGARDGKHLTLAGYNMSKARASQTVNINADSSTTFILSAWGKTAAVADNGAELTGDNDNGARFFGLIAQINYADSTTEYHYIPFNRDCMDWQYVSGVVVPKESGKTIASITVSVAHDYSVNRAWVDDVSLIQEPVQTYTYDEEGNLTQASDSENANISTEYDDDNRLTGYTNMAGVKYTVSYTGDSRNPASMVSDGVTTAYTYNTGGSVTQTSVTGDGLARGLISTAAYSDDGNYLTSSTDVNGLTTAYSYNTTRGLLWSTTAANGTVTQIRYNANNDRYANSYINGVVSAIYGYTNGTLTSVQRKAYTADNTPFWLKYVYDINNWGLTTAVWVYKSTDGSSWSSGRRLVQNTYENGYGNLTKQLYANGQYVVYTYDFLDRVVRTQYYSSTGSTQATYYYIFNSQGQLGRQYARDSAGTITEDYRYAYDSLGRIIYSQELDSSGQVQRIQQLYDTANRLKSQSWTAGSRNYSDSYTYNSGDGSLHSVTTAAYVTNTTTYSYDQLKRKTAATVTNASGTTIFKTAWSYWNTSTTQTTTNVRYHNVRDPEGTLILGWQYTYDDAGNIIAVAESESKRVLSEYAYDVQGQLTSTTIYTYSGDSTTPATTTTYAYTYDSAGNIRSTTEDGTTVDYTYGNASWADLLTAYDGVSISYDSSGNPTSWYNGSTYSSLTWTKGRQLTSLKKGTSSISYTYDMAGVRSSKTVDGVVHNYVTQNGKVVRETFGSTVLNFIYDADGRPFAMEYSLDGGTTVSVYYYVLNLQGDVMRLITASGDIRADYSYGPYGETKVLDINGNEVTNPNSIGMLNPLRYRGYYCDNETGFYYVSSRYYDPEIGRWINADDTAYLGADGTLLSYNLFAYCKNNPVNGYDPTGHWDWNLFGKVLVTTVVVVGCLTGVGAIAAAAAAATATSVAAAVTVSVATAGVSTALSAVDGAICAQQSGGKWYDGAMAGAIGGSAGALVSSITNPASGTDAALRMNTAGRIASSLLYDVSYDLFSTGEIKADNVATYAVDVTMDATLAPINYFYTGNISNGYLKSCINGLVDGAIDVFQTIAYFSS